MQWQFKGSTLEQGIVLQFLALYSQFGMNDTTKNIVSMNSITLICRSRIRNLLAQ